MIKLDTKSGVLHTHIGTFNPKFSHAELDDLIEKHVVDYKVDYDNIRTYRFQPDEEGALPVLTSLQDGKLQFVEVLAKPENGETKEENLQRVLASLGGDKDYWWGHVRIVRDEKSGYDSVYVIYHERKVYI